MDIEHSLQNLQEIAIGLGEFQRKNTTLREPNPCSECGAYVGAPIQLSATTVEEVGIRLLCFHCIEKVLGRPLVIADIVPCLYNHQLLLGYAIAKRETKEIQ